MWRRNHWFCLFPQEKGCPSRQGEFKLLYELLSPRNPICVAVSWTEYSPSFETPPSLGGEKAISPALPVKSSLNSFAGKAAQLYSIKSQSTGWKGTSMIIWCNLSWQKQDGLDKMVQHHVQLNLTSIWLWGLHHFPGEVFLKADCSHCEKFSSCV